jgi:hypothetical protein
MRHFGDHSVHLGTVAYLALALPMAGVAGG